MDTKLDHEERRLRDNRRRNLSYMLDTEFVSRQQRVRLALITGAALASVALMLWA